MSDAVTGIYTIKVTLSSVECLDHSANKHVDEISAGHKIHMNQYILKSV